MNWGGKHGNAIWENKSDLCFWIKLENICIIFWYNTCHLFCVVEFFLICGLKTGIHINLFSILNTAMESSLNAPQEQEFMEFDFLEKKTGRIAKQFICE